MEHPLFIYYHSDLQTSAEEIGTNSELIVHLTIIPPLFICFPFIIILYITTVHENPLTFQKVTN